MLTCFKTTLKGRGGGGTLPLPVEKCKYDKEKRCLVVAVNANVYIHGHK